MCLFLLLEFFSDAWKIFTVLFDGGVAIRRVCLLVSLFVRSLTSGDWQWPEVGWRAGTALYCHDWRPGGSCALSIPFVVNLVVVVVVIIIDGYKLW